MSNVFVVVGGQYGSEAKGHVTAKFVKKTLQEGSSTVVNVRVAGPNAGHTVYDHLGRKFAFRQVPVGAVLGKNILTVIAAGSEVEPEVLFKELAELKAAGHPVHLFVDQNATLIEEHHKEAEADAELVKRIGSTGKGIGAARQARLARTARRVQDDQFLVHRLESLGVHVVDTKTFLRRWLEEETIAVIIEGTQGYGLGLHTEAYPQVTSSDCTAVDFLAMAGISPWAPGVTKVMTVVVCRVYPIRVAGNSGPMQGETTWEALGLPEERTTVTQKVRRVGQWDARLVREAVLANGGGDLNDDSVVVALTMADQKVPEFKDFEHCEPGTCSGHPEIPAGAFDRINALARQVQEDAGAPVVLITTGPDSGVWV